MSPVAKTLTVVFGAAAVGVIAAGTYVANMYKTVYECNAADNSRAAADVVEWTLPGGQMGQRTVGSYSMRLLDDRGWIAHSENSADFAAMKARADEYCTTGKLIVNMQNPHP